MKQSLFKCPVLLFAGLLVTLLNTTANAQEGTITLPNTTTLPVVTVQASIPNTSETNAAVPGAFTLRRTGGTNASLTVFYRLGGSASNGLDYATLPGSVTIPAGSSAARVFVTPLADTLAEDAERVELALTLPEVTIAIYPPPPPPYTIGTPGGAAVSILDSGDSAPPTNRPPVVALASPANNARFTAPANITLIASAYDYDGSVSTVEFFEGTNSLGVATNNPLIMQPLNFGSTAPISPFHLVWTNVPVGEYTLTARATDNSNAVTISTPVRVAVATKNIQSVVTVTAADAYASEGPLRTSADSIAFNAGILPTGTVDTAMFTLRRTGSTNLPLTVRYTLGGTAGNGVDYAALPDSVTIPAGERSVNVVITPVDDALVEGVETVSLAIEPPVCVAVYPPPPDCFYNVGLNSRATASIRDNDFIVTNAPPTVRLVSPANHSIFVASASIRLVADAWDRDGAVTAVEFFEGTNSLGVVTNVPRVLASVNPFQLVWSNVTAGAYVLIAVAVDNKGASAVSASASVTVLATNPAPVVFIRAVDGYAFEQTTNPAAFRVFRKGDTSADLVVNYAVSGTASNGVDYAALPGAVTIPAGTNSADVLVTPVSDGMAEGIESVTLTVRPVASSAAGAGGAVPYVCEPRQHATALIFDQEPVPVPPLPGGTNTVWRLNGPPLPGASGAMTVSGAGDRTVVIEVSSDLQEWQYHSHGVMVDGVLQFNDPDTATAGTRFYRVVAP